MIFTLADIKFCHNFKVVVMDKSTGEQSLKNMKLHSAWTLFLYDKKTYKKIMDKPEIEAKPHRFVAELTTVDNLIYFLKLMGHKAESKLAFETKAMNRLNLDMNDYIVMRKGIEPIWEDPKNFNGGTFSVKMSHAKAYEVWSLLMMYMMGETLTKNMDDINGITVSYVSDINNYHNNYSSPSKNNTYTFIKIWDANPNRTTAEEFIQILPSDIVEKIKGESLMYFKYNKKKHFNDQNIIGRIHGKKEIDLDSPRKERGGFKRF